MLSNVQEKDPALAEHEPAARVPAPRHEWDEDELEPTIVLGRE